MKSSDLLKMVTDMSMEEKIGQLLQLDGNLFSDDISFETGPASELGFTTLNKQLCGSVLNICGADNVKKYQDEFMKNHPHSIPLLFMLDIINGYRTVFPIPLAQGCTFSPELVQKIASVTALESSTDGIHVTFSPMCDLVNDFRWGRVMESTGEDPYLNAQMSAAVVAGYQGENLDAGKMAACIKHFAGYGAPLGGREYNTVELSERTLFEDYMPAYQSAIDAGCQMVMTSFNTLGRIPSSGNKMLLQDILRNKFGFKGVVISDYNSVGELIAHGVAENKKEAAKLAFDAGVDVEMCGTCYTDNLESLIKDDHVTFISENKLNDAVLRMLELKNQLGLFENPYKDANKIAHESAVRNTCHRQTALEACVKSFVLLKNDDDTLPLSIGDSVSFIGPYADNPAIHGAWSHQAIESDTVTIKKGVLEIDPNAKFAKGCSLLGKGEEVYGFGTSLYTSDFDGEKETAELEYALSLAGKTDTVVLCLGEHRCQSGEGGSSVNPTIPAHQIKLLKKVHEINHNIVLILFSGRPLVLTEVEPYCKSILCVWFPGTEGGHGIGDVLYGKSEPGGKLSMTFPRHVGQAPITYRELNTGRPYFDDGIKSRFLSRYQDCANAPLYPFGFGLGYTTFSCSDIKSDLTNLHQDGSIQLEVTITNTGHRFGREIVQLYLSDPVATVCRPRKELKSFKEVNLPPKSSCKVSFSITEPMLRFYDVDMNYKSEPGLFRAYIGFDSNTDNMTEFTME